LEEVEQCLWLCLLVSLVHEILFTYIWMIVIICMFLQCFSSLNLLDFTKELHFSQNCLSLF